jgi:hypothetical protein
VHTLAALALTLALAGGITGLGDLLGGKSAGDRWVRGWTLVWWLVALTAQVAGPRVAVFAGLATVAAGVARGACLLVANRRITVVYASAIVAGALLWLTPPYFYDALLYHLGLPWSWLVNGTFQPPTGNTFSHFPQAGATLYLMPVALGVPEAAAGLHWATYVVALATTARLAGNLGAGCWRWLAPVLLAGCWHSTWIGSVAAVDQLVVLGVTTAAERLTASRGGLRLDWVGAGFGWGLALAAKYQAANPVLATVLVALVALRHQWRRVVTAAALAAALCSFWWVRNLLLTGNPVFPLFWGVLGGSPWTVRDHARWQVLMQEGVGGLASVPAALAHLVVPPDGLGWWFLLALPLLIAALARRDAPVVPVRTVTAASLLILLGWLASSHAVRYALPLAAFVSALAATGVAGLGKRPARVMAGGLALAAFHGILGLTAFAVGTLRFDLLRGGALTPEAWRHMVTLNDPLPSYRSCDRILPADARVLVVGELRPYGCPRVHDTGSPVDLQRIQGVIENAPDAETVAVQLHKQGWTHLIINWSELERLRQPGYRMLVFSDGAAAARWRAFLRRCTSTLWEEDGSEIRQLQLQCTPLDASDMEASR